MSYQAVQLITGHGNFRAYLHRIGRRDDPNCDCGAEDTAGHVLFDCPGTAEWRARAEAAALRRGLRWPRNDQEINDRETADWWKFFSAEAGKLNRLKHDR